MQCKLSLEVIFESNLNISLFLPKMFIPINVSYFARFNLPRNCVKHLDVMSNINHWLLDMIRFIVAFSLYMKPYHGTEKLIALKILYISHI